MVSAEILRLRAEPGVVRNEAGRITETGWPKVTRVQYPATAAELAASVRDQTDFEKLVVQFGSFNVMGEIHTATGVFNLASFGLVDHCQKIIKSRMAELRAGETLNVADLGGGNGLTLQRMTIEFTNRYSAGFTERHKLRTTLTTLINHDPKVLEKSADAIDELVIGMAVELPRDDFFGKFDLVVAQNSVFYWSRFPELAMLNLYKMLKPGGTSVVTAPTAPQAVAGDEKFDIINLIRTCPFMGVKELGVDQKGISFQLEKGL